MPARTFSRPTHGLVFGGKVHRGFQVRHTSLSRHGHRNYIGQALALEGQLSTTRQAVDATLLRPSRPSQPPANRPLPPQRPSEKSSSPVSVATAGLVLPDLTSQDSPDGTALHMRMTPPQHLVAKPTKKSETKKQIFSNIDPYIQVYDSLEVQVDNLQWSELPGTRRPFRRHIKPLASLNQLLYMPFKYSRRLLENMHRARFNLPTPVQRHAIPVVQAGRDLLAVSQTGTGKTAAYLVPVLGSLMRTSREGGPRNVAQPSAIILAPTRELAQQIWEEVRGLVRGTHIKAALLVGGVPLVNQVLDMRGGVDLVVATPGRLLEHVEVRGSVRLERVRVLVVDEADKMLDLGFEPEMRRLVAHPRMTPALERQTLMFSATLSTEVRRLAADFLLDPVSMRVGQENASADLITQRVELLPPQQRGERLLQHVAEAEGLTLVFTNTVATAIQVHSLLVGAGHQAALLHGDLPQVQRDEAVQCFKFGVTPILVATGIAGRGMDIPDVRHVINFDVPREMDEYVHRIGRTGRAGRRGASTSYLTPQDEAVAGALLEVLQQSGQERPAWLYELAARWQARGEAQPGAHQGAGEVQQRGSLSSRPVRDLDSLPANTPGAYLPPPASPSHALPQLGSSEMLTAAAQRPRLGPAAVTQLLQKWQALIEGAQEQQQQQPSHSSSTQPMTSAGVSGHDQAGPSGSEHDGSWARALHAPSAAPGQSSGSMLYSDGQIHVSVGAPGAAAIQGTRSEPQGHPSSMGLPDLRSHHAADHDEIDYDSELDTHASVGGSHHAASTAGPEHEAGGGRPAGPPHLPSPASTSGASSVWKARPGPGPAAGAGAEAGVEQRRQDPSQGRTSAGRRAGAGRGRSGQRGSSAPSKQDVASPPPSSRAKQLFDMF